MRNTLGLFLFDSLTAEDIEEIHKIPEEEFQAIVKKKLEEFQAENDIKYSSQSPQVSDWLAITDTRLGVSDGVCVFITF